LDILKRAGAPGSPVGGKEVFHHPDFGTAQGTARENDVLAIGMSAQVRDIVRFCQTQELGIASVNRQSPQLPPCRLILPRKQDTLAVGCPREPGRTFSLGELMKFSRFSPCSVHDPEGSLSTITSEDAQALEIR